MAENYFALEAFICNCADCQDESITTTTELKNFLPYGNMFASS